MKTTKARGGKCPRGDQNDLNLINLIAMTYLHWHSGEMIAYLKKCAMLIAMGTEGKLRSSKRNLK